MVVEALVRWSSKVPDWVLVTVPGAPAEQVQPAHAPVDLDHLRTQVYRCLWAAGWAMETYRTLPHGKGPCPDELEARVPVAPRPEVDFPVTMTRRWAISGRPDVRDVEDLPTLLRELDDARLEVVSLTSSQRGEDVALVVQWHQQAAHRAAVLAARQAQP